MKQNETRLKESQSINKLERWNTTAHRIMNLQLLVLHCL